MMSSNQAKKQVVIFGAGGFARLAYVYFTQDSPFEVAAFTVHQRYLREAQLLGLEVLPFESLERRYPPGQAALFVAIGYEKVNQARARVYEDCKRRGYELVSYVSSKALHWGEFEMGDNCFIYEGTVIHPFVKIGNDVIIGSANHIGHDSVIGDHCFMAGHAMIPGYVKIGEYCFIGANTTFRDGISVAPRCVIGGGALILEDTQEGEVYVARGTRPRQVSSPIFGEFMHSPFFRDAGSVSRCVGSSTPVKTSKKR